MKKIIILLCCFNILCGCDNSTSKEKPLTTSEQVEKIMMEDNYIILDVRTKEEYDNEHIVDAINIPYDEIDDKTELDKNKTILVYCRSGKRSAEAYKTLKNLGYDVFDMGALDSIKTTK